MDAYGIITFHTTHFAMKAESVLQSHSLPAELIPLPREFSSNCGLCIRIDWEEKEKIHKILLQNQVNINTIHYQKLAEDKPFQFI